MSERDNDIEFTSKPLNIYRYLQYIVATLIVISALWLEYSYPMRAWINSNINHPVLFHAREELSKTPVISKKLKVIALDDETVRYINNDSLDLYDFALLMKSISKKKPRAILLDRIFAGSQEKHAKFEEAFSILKSIDTPIYSGSFLSPVQMKYRTALNLDDEEYSFREYGVENSKNISFLPKTKKIVYGPSREYLSIFKGLGSLEFNEDGTITPFIKVNENKILPHIAMYTADEIQFRNDNIFVNNRELRLDRYGNMLVNYRPILDYYSAASIKSMRFALRRARLQQAEKNVNEGDVVVVLFNFYTGNTDFIEGGPFGALPGGLFVSTVAESILTSKWLSPIGFEFLQIISLSILGAMFGYYASTLSFWLLSLSSGLLYLSLSIVVFSYFELVNEWFLPMVSMMFVGAIFYTYKRLITEINRIKFETEYYSEKSRRLEEENKAIQLEERLNLGRAIQDILLPENFDFEWSYVNIGIKYQPAQEMSGDWIYVWEREGEQRFIIGDVVGKGPSAAIPVAVIIGVLGECQRLDLSMNESIDILNKRIYTQFKKQITSTLAAACVKEDNTITLYNAGSPGWFQFNKKEDKGLFLGLRSNPLGVKLETNSVSHNLDVISGTTVFTFTDGYLEGARALKKLIRFLEKKDEYNVDMIHDALEDIGKEHRLVDDRSMLSVTIK